MGNDGLRRRKRHQTEEARPRMHAHTRRQTDARNATATARPNGHENRGDDDENDGEDGGTESISDVHSG